jgi:hypothetical protein
MVGGNGQGQVSTMFWFARNIRSWPLAANRFLVYRQIERPVYARKRPLE